MANLYFRFPVTAASSAVVPHNFNLPQVEVNIIDADGNQQNAQIASVAPDSSDPRNKVIVNFAAPFTGNVIVKNDNYLGVKTQTASAGGGGGTGAFGPVQFSRAGNTQNATFLNVDGVTCRLPSGTEAAVGFPVTSDGTVQIVGLRFRSRVATALPADLEVFICEGNGATGSSSSLLVETIPAAVYEHDVALSVTIPAGDWTLAAQRTSGGIGNPNKWEDCVAVFLIG